jgi:hypothetical protein
LPLFGQIREGSGRRETLQKPEDDLKNGPARCGFPALTELMAVFTGLPLHYSLTVLQGAVMPKNRTPRCKCGWLENHASSSSSPIKFDSELNEYYFSHRSAAGESKSLIYHCPSCGGRAPESKRGNRFQPIPDVEKNRLDELIQTVRTAQEVTVAWGEPQFKVEGGTTMIFEKLSKVANIHVVARPDGRVSVGYYGKQVKVPFV